MSEKSLETQYEFDIIRILREFYTFRIWLILVLIVLVIGNFLYNYSIKGKNFKAGIDVYPLTEFKYTELWSLQQNFKYTNEGIFVSKDPKLHPDYRLNPDFMDSNELTLFKKYKDFSIINQKEIMDEVIEKLNLKSPMSLSVADYSEYQVAADLSNRFVTFTFYDPEAEKEIYTKVIYEFTEIVRTEINNRLFKEAKQNIDFINDILTKEEERLRFRVYDLLEYLNHKIKVYRRASAAAKNLGISQPLSIQNETLSEFSPSKAIDKLLALEAAEGLPLIISGYLALNQQVKIFESDMEEIKKLEDEGKLFEIFSIFSEYMGNLEYDKKTKPTLFYGDMISSGGPSPRVISYRRHMLGLLEKSLLSSTISKNISPIVEVKFANIFYYSANNVLVAPAISILFFFLIILVLVFRSFKVD